MSFFEANEACVEVIFVYNSVFKDEGGVVQELVQIRGHEPAALRGVKFKWVCFGCVESVSGKVVNCANFRVLLSVGADMLHKFGFVEGVSDEISIVVAVNSDHIAGARLVGIFLEIVATAGLATVTATTIVAAIIVASAEGHLFSKQVRLNWWFGLTYSSLKTFFNFFHLLIINYFFHCARRAPIKLKKSFGVRAFLFFSFGLSDFFYLHLINEVKVFQ